MPTGFDYSPFISGGPAEEAICELLVRTDDLPLFWGIHFSPDFFFNPAAKKFNGLTFDLLSDFEHIPANLSKSQEIPKEAEALLILADKSTAATLWQIEMAREVNPQGQIFVVGSNALGIKGQQKKIEREIGPTETINVAASCRIFKVSGTQPPHKQRFEGEFTLPSFSQPLCTYPGVFSQKRLDPGSQLLLESLSAVNLSEKSVWDLGCGCGVLGLHALLAEAKFLLASDLSKQAISNTQNQFERFNIAPQRFRTLWSCADSHLTDETFDYILTNPPFHIKAIQRTDFVEYWADLCHRRLKQGGELILVHNQFLPYTKALETRFSTLSILNKNKEYVVIRAIK